MKKIFKNKFVQFGLILLTGLIIGWMLSSTEKTSSIVEMKDSTEVKSKQEIWTCSMHPQIRMNEPGQCPICGMDLIPLNAGSDNNSMGITMSASAMQLADIQTMKVGISKPVKEIRMTGKVQADERMIYSQASHFPGRIEQLAINFTGEEVQKGQTLAWVYSPELITAQEELFLAVSMKTEQPILFDAAKLKLKNWKLSDEQIEKIIAVGKTQEQFPILSDVTGVVLKKKVNKGDYIMKGMTVFEVADLSKVWVLFDVYESDMSWIKIGDKVSFTVQSLPGETFKGTLAFIDPLINPQTRVAKARIEFVNTNLKLKPEMFALGSFTSTIKNESRGIVILKSAVMWTGERSVVYVKNTNPDGVNFEMREVTLGPSLGDSYFIKSGLEAGEEIVVNGTFSVDAAAQLSGKPSMMNPEGGPAMTGHNHGDPIIDKEKSNSKSTYTSIKTKELIQPIFLEYFKLKDALVSDNFEESIRLSNSILNLIENTKMNDFSKDSHKIWMQHEGILKKGFTSMSAVKNIGIARNQFIAISEQFIKLANSFGPFDQVIYVMHCPMANNNKGTNWISNTPEIRNPYFGQAMITCGKITEIIKIE